MSELTVGVDVGGTKIAAGVVDEDGKLLTSTRRVTPATDTRLVLEGIADAHGRWRAADARYLGIDRLEVYERVRGS